MNLVWGIAGLCLLSLSANAALHSRAGGQAYYDDVLQITWLADANLAASNTFGVPNIDQLGRMRWDTAILWTSAMSNAHYLGVTNWRLPTTTQPDPYCANQLDAGSVFGYQGSGLFCQLSEMAQLFNVHGVSSASPSPFVNVASVVPYRSSTEYAPNLAVAWGYHFGTGEQHPYGKNVLLHAWPVRNGDIGNDLDGDFVANAADNCVSVSNPTQCDSDGDGYGNHCDGDMNNNTTTNSQDYVLFRAQLGQPSVGPGYNKADINCNGVVNSQDSVLFRSLLGSPPGPSGLVP